MTTGAPITEQTKAKYVAADTASRTGLASDWRVWVIGALVLLVVAYFWHAHRQAVEAAAAAKNKHPMIPVTAVKAQRGTLKLYLSAIGGVSPFNTTTVKTRVVGAIDKIYYTEGQIVKIGDPLVEIDPRPYEVALIQAQGQLVKDQGTLDDAQITYERDRVLVTQGVIAQQDFDNQKSVLEQARGAVETDKGAVASAKLNIVYSHITAPIAGRIGLRLIDLGNIVQTTDTTGIAVITQLQPISVIFAIPEDDIPKVVKEMRSGSDLPVEAWNRDYSKQLATGKLLTFDNQIDQTTGTVKLKAEFENEDYALFPSQFVNARLLINTVQNAVLVPTAAVQKSPQGNYVYIVKADDSVMQRGVTVGAAQGDLSAIKSGVNEGDTVVTDGVDKLQPGVKVNIHQATFALTEHPTVQ